MRTAAYCREKAARFRELAKGMDARAAAPLIELAQDLEAEADRLDPGGKSPDK